MGKFGKNIGKLKPRADDGVLTLTDEAKAKLNEMALARSLASFVHIDEYRQDCGRLISGTGFRGEAPDYMKETLEAYRQRILPEDFVQSYLEKYGNGITYVKQADRSRLRSAVPVPLSKEDSRRARKVLRSRGSNEGRKD